jgi:thiamine monophosphate kinase
MKISEYRAQVEAMLRAVPMIQHNLGPKPNYPALADAVMQHEANQIEIAICDLSDGLVAINDFASNLRIECEILRAKLEKMKCQ